MRATVTAAAPAVISADRRSRPRLAKADLRKAEKGDWIALGQAVERTRTLCRLSLKEFADALGRDERQVARWIAGTEQAQVAVIFSVARFQSPFVIALAERAGEGIEIETTVRMKRSVA
jgi:hypothetical protein